MNQRVGRPRLQELVLTHYRRLFPNGHIGLTWKQVLAAIVSDGGPSVTAATLRQALTLEVSKILKIPVKKPRVYFSSFS